MEKEENVYETTLGTEKVADSQNCVEDTAEKNDSAVPEKFKDVDALARAYTALQAEFTRRSQRLKELEKRLDNSEAEGYLGAEKLRKNARVRKEENKRFADFVAETEKRNAVEPIAEEPIEGQPSMEVEKENGHTMCEVKTPPDTENTAKKEAETMEKASSLWNAQMQGGASVVSSEHAAIDSETLYTQVCRDENVRLKIIGEYLSSLGKSDAPLMRGGVGTLTTPPKRAASISEAGDMALLYLKKPTTR